MITETNSVSVGQQHHANILFSGGRRDPGWGTYGQMVTQEPALITQAQAAGLRSIGYFETYGQSFCFVGELSPLPGPSDFNPVRVHHWWWNLYGSHETVGDIIWIGVHNFFDDLLFARPYTRSHPRYGGGPMLFPDGNPAAGFNGDPEDPRNSNVYEAGCARNILGDISLEYGYNAAVNAPAETPSGVVGPVTGLLEVDGSYAGLVFFHKDTACPCWDDFTYASTLMVADNGVEGMWSDNFSAWDSFGNPPVRHAFGPWSVAGFQDWLAANYSTSELNTLGISDPSVFDVRSYLQSVVADLGGNPADLADPRWRNAVWLDDSIWLAYLCYKRQTGEDALNRYYATAKRAASDAGVDEFLVAGNDIPIFSLGWVRGNLDMVSTEISPGWGLATGPRGVTLPPAGRFAPIYRTARVHAKSPWVNLWMYFEGPYEDKRLQPGVAWTIYSEMLANQSLPMFHPGNPRVLGDDETNQAFGAFVDGASGFLEGRHPYGKMALLYSSSSVLSQMTPGGFFDHSEQPHQFALWGWGTLLDEFHLQYQILPEWRLASELSGFDTLIVANVQALPATAVDILTPWVQSGGNLVVSHSSGERGGETEKLARYPGGSVLEPLTGVADWQVAPANQTVVHGGGKVVYLRDDLGLRYYQNLESRSVLRTEADVLLSEILAPPELLEPVSVPPEVSTVVHSNPQAGKLWVDFANLDIDVETDTIARKDDLQIRLHLPNWLIEGETPEISLMSPGNVSLLSHAWETSGSIFLEVDNLLHYASVQIKRRDRNAIWRFR